MTRLHVYLVTGIVWVLMAGLCALPTLHVSRFDVVFGGGPVRQWVVQVLLLPMVPVDFARRAVEVFSSATPAKEWMIAAGTLLPYVLALVPILFVAGFTVARLKK